MSTETVVFVLTSLLGSSVITVLITSYFARKKVNAETEKLNIDKENIVADVYEKVIQVQKNESEDDKKEIRRLKEVERIREIQHNECEQRGIALQVRLNIWERKMASMNIDFADVPQLTAFVLDDDVFVRDAFKKKLSLIPNLVVKTFCDLPDIFEKLTEEPEILVLDYRIHGMTIDKLLDTIIKMPKYNPKVILISGLPQDMFEKLTYRPFIDRFFSKDEDYINKAVNFIMEYVSEAIRK